MEVRIKRRHIVKPAIQTWRGTLPLSVLDQIGAVTHNVGALYLYNKPTEKDSLYHPSFNKIVDTLKNSLSSALVQFYPLAGRLHWLNGGRLKLECNAMGAELIEAESSKQLRDFFGESSPDPDFDGLFPLVDRKKPIEELPLFLAQITKFKCGGYSVGVLFSHAVVDGTSAGYFTYEWAKQSRGEPPSKVPPYLDRRILQVQDKEIEVLSTDNNYLVRGNVFSHELPTLLGQTNRNEERKKETEGTIFKWTRNQLEGLKKEANKGMKRESSFSRVRRRPYGGFEAIAAHIWRCSSKARGHQSEQMAALCFPVDLRSHFDPPLPPRYFGNAIMDAVALMEARELHELSLGYICQRIREAKEKVTNNSIWARIKFLEAQDDLFKYQDRDGLDENGDNDDKGVFYGNPNISVASWLYLPIYGLDFGWGKEIYTAPTPTVSDFDGDIVIFPGYDKEGSIIVSVDLQVEHMDKFKEYFYDYHEDTEEVHIISRI